LKIGLLQSNSDLALIRKKNMALKLIKGKFDIERVIRGQERETIQGTIDEVDQAEIKYEA
jgi:hypothetical protein